MEASIGYHTGAFLFAIVAGYLFLGLLWLIPPLRHRRRAWYMSAAALTWPLGFVSISGYAIGHALGALIFTVVAWLRSRPAKAGV
jgi:tellurite resistance protein TehA-like permease